MRVNDEEGVHYLHFNLHIKTCFHDRSTRVRETRYLVLRVRRISRSKAELYTTAKVTRRPWDCSRMPILKYAPVVQRSPDPDSALCIVPIDLRRVRHGICSGYDSDSNSYDNNSVFLRCKTAALAIALLNPFCITLTHILHIVRYVMFCTVPIFYDNQ